VTRTTAPNHYSTTPRPHHPTTPCALLPNPYSTTPHLFRLRHPLLHLGSPHTAQLPRIDRYERGTTTNACGTSWGMALSAEPSAAGRRNVSPATRRDDELFRRSRRRRSRTPPRQPRIKPLRNRPTLRVCGASARVCRVWQCWFDRAGSSEVHLRLVGFTRFE
jgi:hypothetical protein